MYAVGSKLYPKVCRVSIFINFHKGGTSFVFNKTFSFVADGYLGFSCECTYQHRASLDDGSEALMLTNPEGRSLVGLVSLTGSKNTILKLRFYQTTE